MATSNTRLRSVGQWLDNEPVIGPALGWLVWGLLMLGTYWVSDHTHGAAKVACYAGYGVFIVVGLWVGVRRRRRLDREAELTYGQRDERPARKGRGRV